MKQKWLKYASFGVAAVIILILIVATILEKFYGSAAVRDYIYGAPPVILLWGIMAVAAALYLIECKMHRRLATFALHASFVVILLGAFVTWCCGIQGRVHLRVGEEVQHFISSDDRIAKPFPFSLKLKEFKLVYYTGTVAPMDYVSHIEIADGEQKIEGKVSMNNILSHNHYRLYQAGYDKDGNGVTLAVSHDPWGIGITYTGYLLLLLSMIALFFEQRTIFRSLLRHPTLKRGALTLLLIGSTAVASATNRPPTVSAEVGEAFGNLYIYHNNRIAPLQTFTRDFTTKLYGKPTYNGYSAEQVVLGWLFRYDEWCKEPMIKIKGGETKRLLGISGKYARFVDFVSDEEYKLAAALQGGELENRRNAEAANEKFNLINMLCAGGLLKVFPYADNEDVMRWFAPIDNLPDTIADDHRLFITRSLILVADYIAKGREKEAVALLENMRIYQQRAMGNSQPPTWRFEAEKWYNRLNINRPLAMASVALGILCFILFNLGKSLRKGGNKWLKRLLAVGLVAILLYLTLQIALRWVVSGHIPLSNGFETMQFMAWCSALLALVAMPKFRMALPFGYLICGFTLLVAMLGEASPRITQLMPVLQSPLLSIHVAVIMIAYSLLAFTMLNGVTALIISHTRRDHDSEVEYLQVVSRIMLYPAVFLLGIGIFIGAVWANISWGRYWGWDPKEVWALITMLVYAAALHTTSLPQLRKPRLFHTFMVVAFLTVLITYFGVNFLLGGMHSYA